MLLSDSTIKAAKEANLIDYMLTYHPDCVMDYYGILIHSVVIPPGKSRTAFTIWCIIKAMNGGTLS